jgi:RimJ/RimL family protein N-acetyltransferase
MSEGYVPELETSRLRLRAHRRDDFEASFRMWADPAVVKYIGGVPSTEQRAWSRLINYCGLWRLLGFGYWVVEEKSGGAFVGELGFADFKRDIDASMRDVPELGWALLPEFQGRGYATEGLNAALAWGDEKFTRTVALIEPDNVASFRVAEKCGFKEFLQTKLNAASVTCFERLAGSARKSADAFREIRKPARPD